MDKEFFINNRKRLITDLEDSSLMVLYSGTPSYWTGDQTYNFSVDKNFYYITGLVDDGYVYVLSKDSTGIKEVLFIQKDYEEKYVKFLGHRKDKSFVCDAVNILDVRFVDELDEYISTFNNDNFKNLYTSSSYEYEKNLTHKLKLIFKELTSIDNNTLFSKYRLVKQPPEVDNIKNAIDITRLGIMNILKNAKNKEYEYEIEAFYDYEIKRSGVREKAFESIVASGINATTLHYGLNNSKIDGNGLILLDLGVRFKHYCSDISRTFPANGKYSERQKTVYNLVLKAQQDTMDSLKIGITFKELNDITKKSLINSCKEIGLIKQDDEIGKYYYHSVSHPLGLDAHDFRQNAQRIESGMVITVEPGLYIEEESIGIRIEDDILVTDDGFINLSADIPKEVEEIEKIMAEK